MKNNIHSMMKEAEGNYAIHDSIAKCFSVLNQYTNKNVAVSISGGKDSDIVLDLVRRFDDQNKFHYVWFDTGLEYQATKNHLKYLEHKYQITIERERAVKPIPIAVKEYGQPFISKFVSETLGRLQKYGFEWEDEPYEILCMKYPKCKSAIGWWCNSRETGKFGYSMFNINYNQYLKEFLIENPPWFKISKKCCEWAKKKVAKNYIKKNSIDLMILGIRKAEGGIRSATYKDCYSVFENKCNEYRPIFWYKNSDEEFFDKLYDIKHSRCYTEYGFKRTGCVGCPYNRKINDELKIIKEYEPKLYVASQNVFKDTYEYTKMYREFIKEHKNK